VNIPSRKHAPSKNIQILKRAFQQTPVSLVFSEEMVYSCSVSSFSHYQPASASWRTLLYVKEMIRLRFAAGEGGWLWMNVLVNIFAERAHTEGEYVKSACGAIL
jgi:hypothetical protein